MTSQEIARRARRIARELEEFATLSPVEQLDKLVIVRELRDKLNDLAHAIQFEYDLQIDTMDNVAVFLARMWFKDQRRDLSSTQYLWIRRARPEEKMAYPIIAPEAPNDAWFLADNLRISSSWSVEEATKHIRRALQHAPILNPNLDSTRELQNPARYVPDPATKAGWILVA